MIKKIEIKHGDRYGKLKILKELPSKRVSRNRIRMCLCLCDCGKKIKTQLSNLRSGHTKSCRCIAGKHRLSYTATYRSWQAMRHRILDRNKKHYLDIKISDDWINSFEKFLADMGERPAGTSLDRIDNNGNYERNNCRWATNRQQSLNKKSNVLVTFRNKTLTITEWAENIGVKRKTLYQRKRMGWPDKKIICYSS